MTTWNNASVPEDFFVPILVHAELFSLMFQKPLFGVSEKRFLLTVSKTDNRVELVLVTG